MFDHSRSGNAARAVPAAELPTYELMGSISGFSSRCWRPMFASSRPSPRSCWRHAGLAPSGGRLDAAPEKNRGDRRSENDQSWFSAALGGSGPCRALPHSSGAA
jgi:hypothetical protein